MRVPRGGIARARRQGGCNWGGQVARRCLLVSSLIVRWRLSREATEEEVGETSLKSTLPSTLGMVRDGEREGVPVRG